jgi:EAL domain-containing protein (putative c-di-GMP-specific phosphodiesterase class I)
VSASLSHVHASPIAPGTQHPLPAAHAAAVTAAEAIAATAAAEVAAEAAVTAQAAVDVAFEAAQTAAAKATEVAARAVLAAAAAAVEGLDGLTPAEQLTHDDGPSLAAAKVALCVRAVAAAASTAALEAAALVAEQCASDVAATAAAVTLASSHPALIDGGSLGWRAGRLTPADKISLAGRIPGSALDHEQRLIADELRRGIATDELQLHYQPIMHLASGQAVGVEALVRWQHPVRGLLAPQAFIDLAEQTELILPLGAWVLHEACRMAVSLQDRPGAPMTVAVNLSGRQLSDRALVRTVTAALQAAGCSADRLVFEVTETALVTDMAAAADSLRELQALGAGVAIDDFGTGYAPLTYLKQLAADDLKIDRSFVRGLGTDSYDTAIVTSLISLAHNLNVRCVAEGVETLEQLTLLQQLGCDFAQGFLFSRPIDATSLGIWLDLRLTTDLPGLPPTPPETSQVPRILAMHQNGASVHTIAAALNAEGSHTVRGRRWSANSVTQTMGEALA